MVLESLALEGSRNLKTVFDNEKYILDKHTTILKIPRKRQRNMDAQLDYEKSDRNSIT